MIYITYDPGIPFLGMYATEMRTHVDVYKNVLGNTVHKK